MSINLVIDGSGIEEPECVGVDIGRVEDGFVQIVAGPKVVIVMRHDCGCHWRRIDEESREGLNRRAPRCASAVNGSGTKEIGGIRVQAEDAANERAALNADGETIGPCGGIRTAVYGTIKESDRGRIAAGRKNFAADRR